VVNRSSRRHAWFDYAKNRYLEVIGKPWQGATGGGVAGDHQEFNALKYQKTRDLGGKFAHHFGWFASVWQSGGVAKVNVILAWELFSQSSQDG
jgi:hypothetical protein